MFKFFCLALLVIQAGCVKALLKDKDIVWISSGESWAKYAIDTSSVNLSSSQMKSLDIILVRNNSPDTILIQKDNQTSGDIYLAGNRRKFVIRNDSIVGIGTAVGEVWGSNFDTLSPNEEKYYLTYLGDLKNSNIDCIQYEFPYAKKGMERHRFFDSFKLLACKSDKEQINNLAFPDFIIADSAQGYKLPAGNHLAY